MQQRRKRDSFGARPLPANFGKVDTAARFDAARYFTIFRCSGMNPQVKRQPDGGLCLVMELAMGQSELRRKRTEAAHDWAKNKDRGAGLRRAYITKAADGLPVGGVACLGMVK
jgi:hypothetical protein